LLRDMGPSDTEWRNPKGLALVHAWKMPGALVLQRTANFPNRKPIAIP
jgi:hypothetical protein